MTSDHNGSGEGTSRRKVLECMTWAGTGILWTVLGGVPKSVSLLGSAEAATAATQSFTFAQISDSHVGFHVKPVNPDALGTLKEAIGRSSLRWSRLPRTRTNGLARKCPNGTNATSRRNRPRLGPSNRCERAQVLAHRCTDETSLNYFSREVDW